MSPVSILSERQREARIVPAIGAYAIACFLLLPREWVFAGLASFILFGFVFYFKTSAAKTASIITLLGTVLIAHALAPIQPPLSQNLYFVFLAGMKLYILEFLVSVGLMIGLMVVDSGAAGEIKADSNTAWVWIVGAILLYFIFPFPYRLAYVACCPLVVAAYFGKGNYRVGALGVLTLGTFWLGTQLRTSHNYLLLGIVFWGAVAAAWYIRHTEKSLR